MISKIYLFGFPSALGLALEFIGIRLLQIVPTNMEIKDSLVPYLVSAIVALSSVVVFLALYIKKSNQLKDEAIEKAYQLQLQNQREMLKDQKDVIVSNTAAITINAGASTAVAESTDKVAEAVSRLQIWLAERIKN